jgi:H+/gluconate symporter-like permease
MKMEQYIRMIAGTFIMGSLLLSRIHSEYWLLFTAFVGLNLFQSAITKWCLMEDLLAKFGVKKCEKTE